MPRSSTPVSERRGRPPVYRQWDNDGDAKQAILAAARRCFSQYGVHRTTMEDVAREAGIARQYLYRFVSGRDDLLTAVASERIKEIIKGLEPIKTEAKSVADAIVEVSMAAIDATRGDAELRNLLATAPGLTLHEMLIGPNPVIHDLAMEFWVPLFERARATKELRPDLDDDEIVDWLRGVYLMMIIRQDLSQHQEREMIRKFFLPSILAMAPPKVTGRRRVTGRSAGTRS